MKWFVRPNTSVVLRTPIRLFCERGGTPVAEEVPRPCADEDESQKQRRFVIDLLAPDVHVRLPTHHVTFLATSAIRPRPATRLYPTLGSTVDFLRKLLVVGLGARILVLHGTNAPGTIGISVVLVGFGDSRSKPTPHRPCTSRRSPRSAARPQQRTCDRPR